MNRESSKEKFSYRTLVPYFDENSNVNENLELTDKEKEKQKNSFSRKENIPKMERSFGSFDGNIDDEVVNVAYKVPKQKRGKQPQKERRKKRGKKKYRKMERDSGQKNSELFITSPVKPKEVDIPILPPEPSKVVLLTPQDILEGNFNMNEEEMEYYANLDINEFLSPSKRRSRKRESREIREIREEDEEDENVNTEADLLNMLDIEREPSPAPYSNFASEKWESGPNSDNIPDPSF